MKYCLLTFDLEEFDLPLEYGKDIKSVEMFHISYFGCRKVLEILEKNKVKGTFFVSALFALKYPELIKEISLHHEIGLHCFEHKDNYKKMDNDGVFEKLSKAKDSIEKITKKKILGFRAPRFQVPSYKILRDIGFGYDSSYHPTYIPKRYNNFFKTRKGFNKEGVNILPLSVSPILRLPLFWLAFRILPLSYSKVVTRICLMADGYASLIFHPWEFADIKRDDLPMIVKRNSGNDLCLKLDRYIGWNLKNKISFITMSDYLSKNL
ncbi:polysaccharide deacetylase family protein [Candidatus Woesearchaeota archaeon]|nr:polysaccharide deacetylase family protein [Candidatus Woesearchaeota archaeon]